jgi:hypothetical protein
MGHSAVDSCRRRPVTPSGTGPLLSETRAARRRSSGSTCRAIVKDGFAYSHDFEAERRDRKAFATGAERIGTACHVAAPKFESGGAFFQLKGSNHMVGRQPARLRPTALGSLFDAQTCAGLRGGGSGAYQSDRNRWTIDVGASVERRVAEREHAAVSAQ